MQIWYPTAMEGQLYQFDTAPLDVYQNNTPSPHAPHTSQHNALSSHISAVSSHESLLMRSFLVLLLSAPMSQRYASQSYPLLHVLHERGGCTCPFLVELFNARLPFNPRRYALIHVGIKLFVCVVHSLTLLPQFPLRVTLRFLFAPRRSFRSFPSDTILPFR
jgi:hypothetical protein